MTTTRDIEIAFDGALDQVTRAAATEWAKELGQQLGQLEFRLRAERAKALERGTVDPDWVRTTVRWVVEWVPESDLTIIAAVGRIARLSPGGLS
ncbi:MAG TPA: hypothetical protein VJZ25_05740 [Gemmatimonadaceae bacterium]|nr:hypothetical protein [Gemmatimonadaceae bacterium]